MPPVPFASFLAGSLLDDPAADRLLIALAIWYMLAVRRVPGGHADVEPPCRGRRAAAKPPRTSASDPARSRLMEAGAGAVRHPRRHAARRAIAPSLVWASRLAAGVAGAWRGSPRARSPRADRQPALRAGRAGDLGGRRSSGARDHHPGDQTASRFSLASLRGRTVAMVFFDSHCKQECPLEGRALAAASVAAAQRSARSWWRSASIPSTRRPARRGRDPRLGARRGRAVVLADGLAALTGRGVARLPHLRRAAIDGDIAHTEALYLIDRRGFERSGFLYPFVPGFVTHDLRVLGRARAEPHG